MSHWNPPGNLPKICWEVFPMVLLEFLQKINQELLRWIMHTLLQNVFKDSSFRGFFSNSSRDFEIVHMESFTEEIHSTYEESWKRVHHRAYQMPLSEVGQADDDSFSLHSKPAHEYPEGFRLFLIKLKLERAEKCEAGRKNRLHRKKLVNLRSKTMEGNRVPTLIEDFVIIRSTQQFTVEQLTSRAIGWYKRWLRNLTLGKPSQTCK